MLGNGHLPYDQMLLIIMLLVAAVRTMSNWPDSTLQPTADLEQNANKTELKRPCLKLKSTETMLQNINQTTGLLLQYALYLKSVDVPSSKSGKMYQAEKGTPGLERQSAHPVLLSPGRLHVLSPEIVCHDNIQVPGVFLVGTAL